ncbi:hypothetical protein Stube_02120 [Streptomyces tubercidicus]|uniref:Uncharacterized protein n=1 Tax=Streptomyces tubercidicus TaxID=47759 RepID=A0A640UIQ8_9ACTN|nr:hypothetical protein Stube_02120 [Streptomyces tubercidicus]
MQSGLLERCLQVFRRARPDQERVRHKERAAQPQSRDDAAQLVGGSGADVHDPWQGQTGNHGEPLNGGRKG